MRVFVLVFLALAAAASAHDDDYDCGKTPDSPHCVTGVVAEYWRQCQGGSIIYTTKLKLNEQPDVETTEPLLDYSHPTNPKGVKTGWVNPGNGKALEFSDQFAAKFTGWIDISSYPKGTFKFYLESDDGSELYIGGKLVVDDGGLHGMDWPVGGKMGSIELDPAAPDAALPDAHPTKPGLKSFEVRFFENRGYAGLVVSWEPPGMGSHAAKAVVPASVFSHDDSSAAGGLAPGLVGKYYRDCRKTQSLADLNLNERVPTLMHPESNVYHPRSDEDEEDDLWCWEDPETGDEDCADFEDYFAVRYTGWIHFPKAGTFEFTLASDDGSKFYLGDMATPFIDDDGLHPTKEKKATKVIATAPINIPFRLDYYENNGDSELLLLWDDAGDHAQPVPVPQDNFRRLTNATAPPEVNPGPNGKYVWCDAVALPAQVGDGRCDVENNVEGCWDGGDCCKATCSAPNYINNGASEGCGGGKDEYPHCTMTNMQPGLDAELYEYVGKKNLDDQFAKEDALEIVVLDQINWPGSGNAWPEFNQVHIPEGTDFALKISGFLQIKNPGFYTFYMSSDDGSKLYIDNELLIDLWDDQPETEQPFRMYLAAGFHTIQVRYYQAKQWKALVLQLEGPPFLPDSAKAPIPASLFWNADPCGARSGKAVLEPRGGAKSPFCNGRGTCYPECDARMTHAACYGMHCGGCEAGFYGDFCENALPDGGGGGAVSASTVILIIFLITLAVLGVAGYVKRKPLKAWLLWKLSSKQYSNMSAGVMGSGGDAFDDDTDGMLAEKI